MSDSIIPNAIGIQDWITDFPVQILTVNNGEVHFKVEIFGRICEGRLPVDFFKFIPPYNDGGILCGEWISPQGWACAPAVWADDPYSGKPSRADGPCDSCTNTADVICSTINEEKSLCQDCFETLFL